MLDRGETFTLWLLQVFKTTTDKLSCGFTAYRNSIIQGFTTGGRKEMSPTLADPIAPMRGGGGGRVPGSQPMSTAVHMEPK
jgi:hypothetical protein